MIQLMTQASSLAELLLTTRRLHGASTRAMATALDVGQATVSRWERGLGEPTFTQVLAWARITRQPLEVFIDIANAETAPANAEAVGSVRHEGFEPPTFWLGVSRWFRARRQRRDDAAFWHLVAPLAAEHEVGEPDAR